MTRIASLHIPLALILLTTVAVYLQAKNFDYVSWDDPNYVLHNQNIQHGLTMDGVKQAFTSTRGGMWLPMVWLSYMVDVELFGVNSGAQHMMNLCYHLINTLLIFILLYTLTREQWPSLVVAGLFALHPLRVESVAWVTERKDMLSMMFFLLTLLTYYYYTLKPSFMRYLGVTGCYALALMAKPMVVTLPFVLLLLDYWPLQRLVDPKQASIPVKLFLQRCAEKLPLLLLAAGTSVITLMYQQQTGATTSFSTLPLWDRIGNAIISYGVYLEKTVLPFNLACFYPLRHGVDLTDFVLSLALLTAITAGAVYLRKSHPYLLVGWLWFAGTLFPVSGIAQAGLQAMADRFTYIPLTGIFIALAWGLNTLTRHNARHRLFATAGFAALMVTFTVLSHQQASHWQDDKTLFSHALSVTDNNYLAQTNLAGTLEKENNLERAEGLARASLQLDPNQYRPYAILGNIAMKRKQPGTAANYYAEALSYQPNQGSLHYLLGNAYMSQRRPDLAAQRYTEAIQLDNNDWQAHHRLGIAYAAMGDIASALAQFQQAAKLQPDNLSVALSLAMATEQSGNPRQAVVYYKQILRRESGNLMVYKRLAYLYAQSGDRTNAIETLREVLRRAPNDDEAKRMLQKLTSR